MCTWTDVHIIQAELLPKALEATTQSTDRQRVTRVVAAAMLGSMGAKMLKVSHASIVHCPAQSLRQATCSQPKLLAGKSAHMPKALPSTLM